MICADTSSLVAFWNGNEGPDVALIDQAFAQESLALPPVVLSELLSLPELPTLTEEKLLRIPLLEITEGYWQRAGKLRARLLARGYKAKMADTLIAQSCLDHRAPLITRDTDFTAFQEISGLLLL